MIAQIFDIPDSIEDGTTSNTDHSNKTSMSKAPKRKALDDFFSDSEDDADDELAIKAKKRKIIHVRDGAVSKRKRPVVESSDESESEVKETRKQVKKPASKRYICPTPRPC